MYTKGLGLLPCRMCGRAALMRDSAGDACHKVCAERERDGGGLARGR